MTETSVPLLLRPCRLLGLFEEAWRRQRRRRARLAALAVVAVAAAVCIARLDAPSPPRVPSRPGAAVAVRAALPVTSGTLPAAGNFASLSRAGGHLLLAGGPGGAGNEPLNISGAVTTIKSDRASGTCTVARILPGTVRVGPLRRANCGDPALYGLHVLPVMFLMRHLVDGQSMIGVRIAVADPRVRDGYRLGPVVTTYSECSDCGAQWIVGDGSLWVNAPLAHRGHGSGELLRISARSGEVLQRLAMPQLVRALLAVNRNGLWIAPSVETGTPGTNVSSRKRSEYESLLFVRPGASDAQETVDVGGGGALWLTAAANRVWLQETNPRTGRGRVVELTGADARIRRGPWQQLGADRSIELGEGAAPFAASPTHGTDALIPVSNSRQRIIHVDPATLTERAVATIRRVDAEYQSPAATTQGTAAYFLDPGLDGTPGAPAARLFRWGGSR